MSDIQFNCPKCGHNLVVDAAGAGMSVPCPECNEPLVIPGPEEQAAAPADNATAGVDTVSTVNMATSEPPLDTPIADEQISKRSLAVRGVARVFWMLFKWVAMAVCLIGWLINVAVRWLVLLPILKACLVCQYRKMGAQAYRNKIDEEKGAKIREQLLAVDHDAEVDGKVPVEEHKSISHYTLLMARVMRCGRMNRLFALLGMELAEGEAVSDSLGSQVRRVTMTKQGMECIRSARPKIVVAGNFVLGVTMVGVAVTAYYYWSDIARPYSNGGGQQISAANSKTANVSNPLNSLLPENAKFVSPLLDAAYVGDYPAVRRLVDQGSDINMNQSGFTPLILAAAGGHLDIVEYLVEKGADVNTEIREGVNAITFAAENLEVIMYLEKMGADLHANMAGMLSISAGNGGLDVVKYLVENGADVNTGMSDELSPLACAAGTGHLDIVKYLVEKGADVNADVLALFYAFNNGHAEVVNYLKGQMYRGEDILGALETRAKHAALNQPDQEDVDPAWYGYGYGLGTLAESLNSLYNPDRAAPASANDLDDMLGRYYATPAQGLEYTSCLAGYLDGVRNKPAKFPPRENAPK